MASDRGSPKNREMKSEELFEVKCIAPFKQSIHGIGQWIALVPKASEVVLMYLQSRFTLFAEQRLTKPLLPMRLCARPAVKF